MLVNSGTTLLRFETGELEANAGEVVLLPHGHWYSGLPSGHVTTTTAYFDTTFLREQAKWLPDTSTPISALISPDSAPSPVVIQVPFRDISRIDSALRQLLHGQLRSDSHFRRFRHLAELFDILTGRPSTPSLHESVRTAMTELTEHPEYAWTIQSLAEKVRMSRSQLTRLFQQEIGMGPAEFLRNERARRMVELLIATSGTVESIARHVGWADPSHASRAFRAVTGLSPRHYRDHHRNGMPPP